MIISIDEEKAFNEIFHAILINGLAKILENTYLRMIKAIYEKPAASSILNRENLKAGKLKSGVRQGCPQSSPLFNTLLSALAGAVNQEKESKGLQAGKKEVKLSSFADGTILHIRDPKNFTRNILETINNLSKVTG